MQKIIFLMWVSGSGKTTVLKESGLLNRPDIIYVPSWTTRPLRPGEVNGVKYHHVNGETFQDAIAHDLFLEYVRVHEHYRYGTPYQEIVDALDRNMNVIKELDMHGLLKIQEQHKIDDKYFTIYLDIPTELMTQRIQQRWVLSPEELQIRITSATFESAQAKVHCNYIVDATQPLALVIENVISIIEHEVKNWKQ